MTWNRGIEESLAAGRRTVWKSRPCARTMMPRPRRRRVGASFSWLNRMETLMAYHLEGRLLEVCNCRVLCPCWIGEDPDYKTCDTIVA